jgi:hypothetical protein
MHRHRLKNSHSHSLGKILPNWGQGDYLIAGSWMIEGALELLDAENEYYFDETSSTLYMWPNATTTDAPNGTLVVVSVLFVLTHPPHFRSNFNTFFYLFVTLFVFLSYMYEQQVYLETLTSMNSTPLFYNAYTSRMRNVLDPHFIQFPPLLFALQKKKKKKSQWSRKVKKKNWLTLSHASSSGQSRDPHQHELDQHGPDRWSHH